MAKLTLEDLLAKKGTLKPKKATYTSKELGGELEVVKHSIREVMEIMDRVNEEDGMVANYEANCKLIFKHCPLFRNSELQADFKVGEPFEIVPLLLNDNMQEITDLVNLIMTLYNLDLEEGTEIKN